MDELVAKTLHTKENNFFLKVYTKNVAYSMIVLNLTKKLM